EHGPAPEAGPSSDKAPVLVENSVEVSTGDEPPFFRGRGFAAISATFSWTPEPSYGPSAAIGVGLGRYIWLDLTGSYLPTRESGAEGSALRTLGGSAGLRACAELSNARWFTDFCLAGGWTALKATGIDADENRTGLFSTAELGTDWLGGLHLNS